jgi:hypothetical protein
VGGGFVPTSCLPTFTDGGQLANAPLGKLLLVDLNGDGKLDLVAADVLTMKVFINDGAGHLAVHGSYAVGARISIDVAAGDLNGDGRPDVAIAFGVPPGQIPTTAPTAGVYLNSGDGTLSALPRIALPAAATGIEIGDVDGDHHADLVLSTSGPPYVLPNTSGDGQVGPVTAIDTGLDFGRASLADLNGDGKLDLILPGQPPKAWLNQGGLLFSLSELAIGTDLSVVSSVVTDLDGNGSPDLALLGAVPMSGLGHRNVRVMLNDGHGTLATSFNAIVDVRAQSLAVGDFDRDGHPDLAVSVPNLASPGVGGIVTLMAAAGGTYVASTCTTDVLASGALVAGDLNGDGLADLAINAGAGINLLFSAVLK